MSVKVHLIVLILIFIAIASSCAYAQYESSDRSSFGFGLEVSRPSDSLLNEIESTWLSPSFHYNMKFDKYERPEVVISLAMFSGENGMSKASFIPLKASYIKRYYGEEENGFYIGGGLSAAKVSYKGLGYNPFTRNDEIFDDSGTTFGFNILGGYEYNGIWYAELGYDYLGKLTRSNGSEVDFGGISLSIGSRVVF